MKHLLVTGGAGYIGSHTLIELLNSGYTPIVIDNFSNSDEKVFDRLASITGQRIDYIKGDIRDRELLNTIFASFNKKTRRFKASFTSQH